MIIKDEISEIENFLRDAANYHGNCSKVFFPSNKQEIAEAIKYARDTKSSVTIAGNRTGLTGSGIPKGGIVISTEKLNKIISINKKEKFAILEPGVLLCDFHEAINDKGLFYPPDPTEQNCFIGGTIATNASGAKTFKYGPTRNFVSSLRIMLSNGDTIHLERGKVFAKNYTLKLTTDSGKIMRILIPDYIMPKTKHAAGYFAEPNMDAIDLFIGSEGTLGIIYEIQLRLVDLPKNVLSSIVFFETESDAFNFAAEARNISYNSRIKKRDDRIDALGLEFFDKFALEFISADYANIPQNAKAAIWFEQIIVEENEEEILEQWTNLIEKHNASLNDAWFAVDYKARQVFKKFRHSVAQKVSEYLSRNNFTKVGTDTAVPENKLREFYSFAVKKINENNLQFVTYGHIGNAHLHINMIPKNKKELLTAKNIYAVLCKRAVALGGTISAEHGIGKLKIDYLFDMFGEENIYKMAKLKKTIDPLLLFGIGNMFDEKYLIGLTG